MQRRRLSTTHPEAHSRVFRGMSPCPGKSGPSWGPNRLPTPTLQNNRPAGLPPEREPLSDSSSSQLASPPEFSNLTRTGLLNFADSSADADCSQSVDSVNILPFMKTRAICATLSRFLVSQVDVRFQFKTLRRHMFNFCSLDCAIRRQKTCIQTPPLSPLTYPSGVFIYSSTSDRSAGVIPLILPA